MALDAALGIGGVPKGRIIEIYGPESSGKTTLALHILAEAQKMGGEHFDCAYVDIWHDVLDGVEMYLKMKQLEKCSPDTKFLYWIEPSMLAWLRGMALMEVAENIEGPMTKAIGSVSNVDELIRTLSDEHLKKIAPKISLEVARR